MTDSVKFTYYAAEENSDLTEAKGRQVAFAHYSDEAKAVEAVQGHGVMGYGPGTVSEITVTFNTDADSTVDVNKKTVYGYRKDWNGNWGHGYLDKRDWPNHDDPEFKEYLRLKDKFAK